MLYTSANFDEPVLSWIYAICSSPGPFALCEIPRDRLLGVRAGDEEHHMPVTYAKYGLHGAMRLLGVPMLASPEDRQSWIDGLPETRMEVVRHYQELGEPKMVIVMRTDLGMRKGKMVAQGAHAALRSILNLTYPTKLPHHDLLDGSEMPRGTHGLEEDAILSTPGLRTWLLNSQTKICVGVDSESALLEVVKKAQAARVHVTQIRDEGRTEFRGEPTVTCCAVGPAYTSVLAPITGSLRLL